MANTIIKTATTIPTEPTPEPLQHAWYFYDGDGNMVKGIVNSTVTFYPGRHFNKEVTAAGTKVQKFYFAIGQTIAVRTLQDSTDTLQWILSDHLGSASTTANEDGSWNSTIQYTAFGEIRNTLGITPTKYRYTGQLAQAELGLDFYVSRFYDPYLNRWTQPDTIIPDQYNPITQDRYAYAQNNPIRYNDPTGHDVGCSAADPKCKSTNTISPTKITKPNIISRRNWGALAPGSKKGSEGLFNRVSNPSGYAKYSDLYPSKSLSDVLDTVVFHHEGNQQTYDVAQVQQNEMDGGAYDIAYHFVVGPDGSIYEGRDIGVRGAHVPDKNTGKVGILWLGDFEPGMAFESGLRLPFDINGSDSRPTTAQIDASVNLVSWLDQEYSIDSAYGHTELYGKSVCPGTNAMPFISIFRALVQEIR